MKYFFSVANLISMALIASSCHTIRVPVETTFGLDLSKLPSAFGMVASNLKTQPFGLEILGTPPELDTINSSNVDSIFFNGLIAEINNSDPVTQQQKNLFFGIQGGPGGFGACYMAQSVGESIGRILQNDTTLCYMKGMTQAQSGISISPIGTDAATLFQQIETNKVVKVELSNFPAFPGDESNGPESVLIKTYGTNSVGQNTYKIDVIMCSNNNVTGVEEITVNKETNLYTVINHENSSNNFGQQTIVAFIKTDPTTNTFVFDLTKNRNAVINFKGISENNSWTYKGDVSVKPNNQIHSKRYSSGVSTFDGNQLTFIDKNFSVSTFSGTNMDTLTFQQGVYKGINALVGDGVNHEDTYQGGTTWRNSFYAFDNDTPLVDQLGLVDINTDSFYTNVNVTPDDLSEFDCNITPDVTVQMDFSNSAVAAISTRCESERFDNFNMCNNPSIESAQFKVQSVN